MEPKLIEVVRKHEKTKMINGEKLDDITEDAFNDAVTRGVKLREQYESYEIVGRCSLKHRTYMSCAGWLSGAGVIQKQTPKEAAKRKCEYASNIIVSTSELNPPEIPKSKEQNIRTIKDKAVRAKAFYDLFGKELSAAGRRIAGYLMSNIERYIEQENETEDSKPRVELSITSAPALDAAYLVLVGSPVNFENADRLTGHSAEGCGFDIQLRKEGSLYVLNFLINGKTEQYELERVKANIS